MNKITAAITGIQGYVPNYILKNKELEKMVDTTDEWITTRTGIKERRILKGKGNKAITNYLNAVPGSKEHKEAVEFLYLNVHHKPKKEGEGLNNEDLKLIMKNFNKSYNKNSKSFSEAL